MSRFYKCQQTVIGFEYIIAVNRLVAGVVLKGAGFLCEYIKRLWDLK